MFIALSRSEMHIISEDNLQQCLNLLSSLSPKIQRRTPISKKSRETTKKKEKERRREENRKTTLFDILPIKINLYSLIKIFFSFPLGLCCARAPGPPWALRAAKPKGKREKYFY